MTARDEIAAAVNTVDGLNCSTYARQTPKTGDAWVSIGSVNAADNGWGYVTTWEVRVACPQASRAEVERYAERLLPALLPALDDELTVTQVTFTEVAADLGGSALPCLLVTGHREADIPS